MELNNAEWEQKKTEYLSKLERIEDGIGNLLDMNESRIITSEMRTQMGALYEEAKILRKKLESGEFEIAVVGLEKAGKSSFTNALIGRVALPTADLRCTYTSTCIKRGDEDTVDITFFTRSEFERSIHDKLEKLGIPRASDYQYDGLTIEQYTALYENCSPEKKALYGDSLNEEIKDPRL